MHLAACSRRRHCTWALPLLLLTALLPLTAEDAVPVPAPAPAPAADGDAPTPPAPAAESTPTPTPTPTPAPTLPPDLPKGAARLYLKSGDTPTVENLMLHNDVWYGQQNGARVDYPRADVTGVASDGQAEVKLKDGADSLKTTLTLLRDTRFYLDLTGGSRVTGAADQLAGLYPNNRELLYPRVFGKYIAPWGKAYAQRPFYLNAYLGYVYSKGVVENQVGTARLVVGSDIELWRIRLESAANYGDTEGIITVNNQQGDLKVDRYLASWFYAYGKTGILHDDIALIRYRWTQGLGIGLGTFDLSGWLGDRVKAAYQSHNFDFEAGIEHLNEKDKNAYKEGWFARLAAIDQMRFTNDIAFDNKLEYIPALANNLQADKGQYFIHYVSEFRMSMSPNLAIRLAYNLDYNSKPPQGNPNATHQFSASVGYSIG